MSAPDTPAELPPDPDDGSWVARYHFGDEAIDALLRHHGVDPRTTSRPNPFDEEKP